MVERQYINEQSFEREEFFMENRVWVRLQIGLQSLESSPVIPWVILNGMEVCIQIGRSISQRKKKPVFEDLIFN